MTRASIVVTVVIAETPPESRLAVELLSYTIPARSLAQSALGGAWLARSAL
jgi:hypothetical protein